MASRCSGRRRTASSPPGIIPAVPEALAALAERLSPHHVREVRELCGLPPAEALAACLRASLEAYCYAPAGRPILAMGVEAASPITGGAMPWMLGDPGLARRPRGVLRAARWGVLRAFRATGALWLEQYIPEWYATGRRFARRLGFREEELGLRTAAGSALVRIVLPAPCPGTAKEKPWVA